jgi:patatin-like phospholipase/acyl hydrolase
MTYRILSLDGGGSRALLPVALLQRLVEKQPDLLGQVDLIAGTSTSGITALIVAQAAHPAEALETARALWLQGKALFSENSEKPKSSDLKIEIEPLVKGLNKEKAIETALQIWGQGKKLFTSNKLRGLTAKTGACAYFSQYDLEAALTEIFGDLTMADLPRKVLVPAICLSDEHTGRWAPSLIHNLDDRFHSLTLVEVALRAAAMPILFPIHSEHIDAALLNNNPAMSAVAQALEGNASVLSDMRVLSIGAGENTLQLKETDPDLGYAAWLMDPKLPLALIQTIIETNSQLTDYQCRQILTGKHYFRLNPELPHSWLMHEHRAHFIVEASDLAEDTDIQATLDWLHQSGWSEPSGMAATPSKRKRA